MSPDVVVIDASLFMGMHSTDERVRVACKAFVVERLAGKVVMPLEEVGRCDDLVWRSPRSLQDAYYPFMDHLHTDMSIERRGYEEADLQTALESPALAGLGVRDRLLLGTTMNLNARLWSVNGRLPDRPDLPVRRPSGESDLPFPPRLETLYRASLQLRVTPNAMEEL
jgi:Family of unknown function (DUF6190)